MTSEAVNTVTTRTDQTRPGRREPVSTEELVRLRGARPIDNPADMARDVFASDEELDEFLAFVHEIRHPDQA